MTIPWLMNCGHSESGWCLECVVKMGNELSNAKHSLDLDLDIIGDLIVCVEALRGHDKEQHKCKDLVTEKQLLKLKTVYDKLCENRGGNKQIH